MPRALPSQAEGVVQQLGSVQQGDKLHTQRKEPFYWRTHHLEGTPATAHRTLPGGPNPAGLKGAPSFQGHSSHDSIQSR